MWQCLVHLWVRLRGKKTMSLPHQGLTLTGTATVLRDITDAPTVYLIDEKHKHDPSTDENVENAMELIKRADARLVGVEGYKGGFEYNGSEGGYTKTYVDGDLTEARRIGEYPRFAKAMTEAVPVVGVDCEGFSDEMLVDVAENKWEKDKIGDHPNQAARSRHFIKTLFEERTRLGLGGSLILNCGSKHNRRFEAWILDGTIDQLTGQAASFVRLRAASYPAEQAPGTEPEE